jgi:hypothetical protein
MNDNRRTVVIAAMTSSHRKYSLKVKLRYNNLKDTLVIEQKRKSYKIYTAKEVWFTYRKRNKLAQTSNYSITT